MMSSSITLAPAQFSAPHGIISSGGATNPYSPSLSRSSTRYGYGMLTVPRDQSDELPENASKRNKIMLTNSLHSPILNIFIKLYRRNYNVTLTISCLLTLELKET